MLTLAVRISKKRLIASIASVSGVASHTETVARFFIAYVFLSTRMVAVTIGTARVLEIAIGTHLASLATIVDFALARTGIFAAILANGTKIGAFAFWRKIRVFKK